MSKVEFGKIENSKEGENETEKSKIIMPRKYQASA